MLQARRAVRQAVRTVVELLEDRRLLASASIGGEFLRGYGQYIPVTLTGPNAPTLTTVNLSLQNLKTPDAAEVHPVSVSTTGAVATFKINSPTSSTVSEPLADGWYNAYVRHPNLNEAASTFRFFNADFDGDGGVSTNDYNTLAANYGKTQINNVPVKFEDGDADYDGGVSINDFNLLAARFGMQLPNLPTQAGGVAVGNTTAGTLDVVWTADPSQPRDGFKIYRSDDGGLNFYLIDTVATPAARAWQDPNSTTHPLTLGEKYWYRVRSYTTANGANASVTKASGIPTRPTPAVSNLHIAGIGPGRIALKWKTPVGGAVKGYRIYGSTSPTFLPSEDTLVTTVSDQRNGYVDSGLSRGHVYHYRVVAVGVSGSVAMPSLKVSSRAQNEGSGFSNASNGGEPFNPTSEDSDGDGTVDVQDFDNDNDGTVDTDDDDDDNNGVPDNAEPDDRDSDGDGDSDNDDGNDDDDQEDDAEDTDDDNDMAEDEEDASTGTFEEVPSGPGQWGIFSTRWQNVSDPSANYGLTPKWAELDYEMEESGDDPITGETYNFGPKLGGFDNDTQRFTISNLPKHSLISFGTSLLGGGFQTPDTPADTGDFEVTFGGQQVESYYRAWGYISGGIARFTKTIESTGDDVTISFTGSGFAPGNGWGFDNFTITVTMPEVWVSGGGTADEETESSTTITVNRSGPTDFSLDVSLEKYKADGLPLASAADFSGALPTNVHFSVAESSKTITITAKDDADAEGEPVVTNLPAGGTATGSKLNEAVVFKVKKNEGKYVASVETAKVEVVDSSTWYYSDWEDDGPRPLNFQATVVGHELLDGEDYTAETTIWKIDEWVAMPDFGSTSQDFGLGTFYSGQISWGATTTYGWNIGGSVGSTFDLKDWIHIPITINGSYKADYSATTGGSINVSGSAPATPNQLKSIRAYRRHSYLLAVSHNSGTNFGAGGPITYDDLPHEASRQELGFSDSPVQYTKKLSRVWLDADDPRTFQYQTGFSTAEFPAIIKPSNYPHVEP